MKVIINNYAYRNRNFTIVFDQGHYLAIENKYIDAQGKTTQALNGLQMYASNGLNGCLTHLRQGVDIDYYESQGMSRAEAFAKALGLPQDIAAELESILQASAE